MKRLRDVPLPGRSALAERALDLSLLGAATTIGAGIDGAWIFVALAAALALGMGKLRPTALAKPFALFGVAFLLGAVVAGGGNLGVAHAWSMGRPGIAILLAGAVRDRSRAFFLAAAFVCAAAARGLLALVAQASPSEARDFLAAAALILLAAGWIAGSLRGRLRLPALLVAAALVASLWPFASLETWLAVAGSVATTAIVSRRLKRGAVAAALALALAAGFAFFAPPVDPPRSQGLGFLWASTLEELARAPTGIGAGNFAVRISEALVAQGRPPQEHPRNSLLAVWIEHGPLGLLAAVWLFGAAFAALRRGWKGLEEEAALVGAMGDPPAGARSGDPTGARSGGRAIADAETGLGAGAVAERLPLEIEWARWLVLGAAGVAALLLAWSFDDDPLGAPVVGYALGLLLALGLAASGPAAHPDPDESLLPQYPGRQGPRARKAAGGAALAIAGAALGGTASLHSVQLPLARGSLLLLLAIVLLHLPLLLRPWLPGLGLGLPSAAPAWWWIPARVAASLRGLFVFAGAALLAVRPFAEPLTPGSAPWWQSASAGVALCSLGAAVAGAGHAIRRPGRIGPAPVAGAIACLGILTFVSLLEYGLIPSISNDFAPSLTYNFAAAAFVVSVLWVAWSGPLSFGEAEQDGTVGRLARLPAAAVAAGLLAVVVAGFAT